MIKRTALMLLAAAFLTSSSVVSLAAPKSTKVDGWVSNEKCGAKDIDNADCTKKCAGAGSKLVIVSEKDKNVINVDNPDALQGHEGHHVSVTGTMDNGVLHVTKVSMLKQSGM